jgi:hypothetical protein
MAIGDGAGKIFDGRLAAVKLTDSNRWVRRGELLLSVGFE